MNKKIIPLLALSLLTIYSCDNDNSNSNSSNLIDFNIIEFNDVHGYVESNKNGGLANASYLLNEIRNQDSLDNTLVIGNGDMFQGTALVRMDYGKSMIDMMNQMEFDATCIGNHEFDWGLDKILTYFDGDKENGEAKFPLLNANLYDNSSNELVGYDSDTITPSTIVEKEGVKIGIIGYIGNVASSINYNMIKDYTIDTDFSSSTAKEAKALKAKGCEIIVVSIHGASSSGVYDYNPNKQLARIKDDSGNYLIDAVINGHTHTNQDGIIERDNSVGMPVIQSSGNLKDFGRIKLTYNRETKTITKAITSHIDVNSTKYDENITNIIEATKKEYETQLTEVYCYNSNTINRYNDSIRRWAGTLMMTSTNTNVAIYNAGALRSNLNKGEITYNEVYSFNPFDNHIIVVPLSGKAIKDFMSKNDDYEVCITSFESYSMLEDNEVYSLSIIDYVYFSSYFDDYRPSSYNDTNIILRDLMIKSFKTYKDTGFKLN